MNRKSLLLRASWLILLCLIAEWAAAIEFPALTGRVVDEANLLSPGTRAQLTERLAQHERETSNQLVIVTIKSLQGLPIEDYGYQLGRAWGIGQEKRNNGVLLIVAPNERKVRIEVGYGLEGALTDVQSHLIIQNAILPRFREGNFEAGIVEGTDAILGTLAGTYEPTAKTHSAPSLESALFIGFMSLIFGSMLVGWIRPRAIGSLLLGAGTGAIIWFVIGSTVTALVMGGIAGLLHLIFRDVPIGNFPSGGWGGGSTSGGSWSGGDGGFSGGGGSFGGGGSSGDW